MGTKPRLSNFTDVKPDRAPTLDADGDSVISFASGPVAHKQLVKYAWGPNDRVNHETFHRMVGEYREAKRRELDLELKAKQLAAQLARTEEAAKRALVQTDATAKGGAAQKLLDAERSIQKLRDENADLRNKLSREKKKVADTKTAHDDMKRRLDTALRDSRMLAKKVGDVERKNAMLTHKPEDEFWGEEAGRRFAVQQEELVSLREDNSRMKQHMETLGLQAGGADTTHLESQLQELTALVKFYEKKISTLAEQQIISPQDSVPGGPSSDDWILEEHVHKDEVYLLDRKTGKLFTNPGEGAWPRAVGVRTGSEVKLGSLSKMERFLDTLDHYMQRQGERLREVFNEYDLDNSGFLDRRELARLIQKLMPDAQARDVEELRTMLDQDGDGQITYEELLGTIKEATEARMASKVGKSIQVNETLERTRKLLKENKKVVREAFQELDSDHDGCLYHMEVVRLVKRFMPDMYQKEIRYLLAKLQEWDVTGEGKCAVDEIYQALELVKIYRVGQGMGGLARQSSPVRTFTNGSLAAAAATTTAMRQSGGLGLKEGFMRDRVAQLEAELKTASQREHLLESEAQQVNELRRDLSAYKLRVEDLEKDFMRMDVLNKLGEAEGSGDDRLKKAWETASMFKKRYMEHKAELDSIKVTYARMQAQLDETHRLLNEEHKRRFRLEDDSTRLNMELQRIKDLEARLNQERAQRVKLETEYLSLQNRAFNAPGQQLVEVRQLTEEVFALRRARAIAEKKEVEVRTELGLVREQLDGMDLEHYRAWQRENQDLKNRLLQLELELQAALDKLEVYRRTQEPAVSDVLLGANNHVSVFTDRRPDADKNEEELRIELGQLRDVWRMDKDELNKLHKVLELEEAKCMEAKAALEDAHREMDRLRREYQDQIRGLQRELENRDERIRRLEVQLRGAYLGVNNAMRANGVRDSLLTGDPDDMSEIGEMQNILELHISDANVFEEAVGQDPSVFFSVDFYLHETQATQVVASNKPAFNTVIQYVVEQEPFLVEHLDTHVLELELNKARGWDFDFIGVARVPLRQVLQDVDIGAALGHNLSWHHADVFGADGRRIGRVRYGFRFRKPLDSLIKQYKEWSRSKRPSEPYIQDPAFIAVESAAVQPKHASHIKVVVAGCKNLVPARQHGGPKCRPYVHYRFPGHRDLHTTKALHGLNPEFKDETTWLIARTPELEADFKKREMQFMVFDDSAGDDSERSVIGIAFVPLNDLARGLPVEGTFNLVNPLTRQKAGQIVLGLGWHNPLRLPGELPPADPALGDMLMRGPSEVPINTRSSRVTAESDVSLRGYMNPQQGPGKGGGGFGLGAEVATEDERGRGQYGLSGHHQGVPLDEFGVPLRPSGGLQRPIPTLQPGAGSGHSFGFEAEVALHQGGGLGMIGELGNRGQLSSDTGLSTRGYAETAYRQPGVGVGRDEGFGLAAEGAAGSRLKGAGGIPLGESVESGFGLGSDIGQGGSSRSVGASGRGLGGAEASRGYGLAADSGMPGATSSRQATASAAVAAPRREDARGYGLGAESTIMRQQRPQVPQAGPVATGAGLGLAADIAPSREQYRDIRGSGAVKEDFGLGADLSGGGGVRRPAGPLGESVEEEGVGFGGSGWDEQNAEGPLPGGLTPPRGSMLLPGRRGSGAAAGAQHPGVPHYNGMSGGSGSMRYGGLQESMSPLRASGGSLHDYY